MTESYYLQRLIHRDVTIRKQALQALSTQPDPALLKLIIRQPQLFEADLQELLVNIFVRNRSRWAAEIASELLYATQERMRQLGITILHRLGDVSLKPLRRLQHSANPRVRMGVLQALAGIHTSVHWDWIKPFLTDPDKTIVREAVNLIRRYGDEFTVIQLRETFVNYPELRSSIMWAYARFFHPEQLLHLFKSYIFYSPDLLNTFLHILNGYAPKVVNPILSRIILEAIESNDTSILNIVADHLRHQISWELPEEIAIKINDRHLPIESELRLSLLAACKSPAFVHHINRYSANGPSVEKFIYLFTRRFPHIAFQQLPLVAEPVLSSILQAITPFLQKNTPEDWDVFFQQRIHPDFIIRMLNMVGETLPVPTRATIYKHLIKWPPQDIINILNRLSSRKIKEELLAQYLSHIPHPEAVFQEMNNRVKGLGYLLISFFTTYWNNPSFRVEHFLNDLDPNEIFYIISHLVQAGVFNNSQQLLNLWENLSPSSRPAFLLALLKSQKNTSITQFIEEFPTEISAETMILTSEFLDILALQPTPVQYAFLTLIYFE